MAGKGIASRLNRLVRIERNVGDASFRGAGKGAWVKVADAYAEVQDILPSRAEKLEGGINLAHRPARVRMRYRDDVTADMRLVMGSRIMQIVAGPAEIGRRELVEFRVEDFAAADGA